MTTTKVLLGILGAAAAGVAIGLLIAPEKGSDLRNNISKTAGDWADEVTDWMGKGKQYLNDMKSRATDQAEALASEGEEALTNLKRKRSSYQS